MDGEALGAVGVVSWYRSPPVRDILRCRPPDVVAIVGTPSRARREHLQGSSPPRIHREGLDWFGTRAIVCRAHVSMRWTTCRLRPWRSVVRAVLQMPRVVGSWARSLWVT